MKSKNFIVICFSALLFLLAVFWGFQEHQGKKNHSISLFTCIISQVGWVVNRVFQKII